jgi:hypothetical protein
MEKQSDSTINRKMTDESGLLECYTVSIAPRRLLDHEDEGTTMLRNVGNCVQARKRNIPEDLNLRQHLCENHKFRRRLINCRSLLIV